MPLRDVNIGDVVVCVVIGAADDRLGPCLTGLLEHTAAEIPLLFAAADAGVRRRIEERLGSRPGWFWFAPTVDAALSAGAPADVVLLAGDVVVSSGWLESLREAAYSESRVATATALTNDGTIVSVPHRNRALAELPEGMSVDAAAAAVREASLRLRPDVPTCLEHCVYIRRSAIDLAGSFSEGAAVFAQRCVVHGLRHVVADDVFVFRRAVGRGPVGRGAAGRGAAGRAAGRGAEPDPRDALVERRYPFIRPWIDEVSQTSDGPLGRALSVAASALRPLTVTVDGRCLGPTVTGTQLVTLGVIGALETYTDLELRVLVPDDLGAWAAAFLEPRSRVVLLRRHEIAATPPADVVHRPYQVASRDDVALLSGLGERLVLTQLDNIALRNPAYFRDYDDWAEYRQLGRLALGGADQVVFISRDSAVDAERLGLVHPDRINVVYPANDLSALGLDDSVVAPDDAEWIGRRPFLLCLGTDFLHKNRLFALRLLEALGEQGFDAALVFAGPKVAAGSSAGEEAEYLSTRPALRERVRDLGAVPEPVKRWLLERAAALVYPTTSEGFGLTPFEAADAGTPCLFASHTSLAEILPTDAALLMPWDPHESARRALAVLRPGVERDAHVRAIREAGARFTSAENARGLAGVYAKALRAPAAAGGIAVASAIAAAGARAGADPDETEVLRRQLSAIYDDPLNRGLVGPYAVLPPELRRPVLAVATRPLLRRSALALYRAGYAVRHRPGRRR